MKLYGISDLHLDYEVNRVALQKMQDYKDDWLIVAGDVGHGLKHLEFAFKELTRRFARVLWVPGNHDVWTTPNGSNGERGVRRYEQALNLCREYDVLTPEDPYPQWPGTEKPVLLAPLFLLYDYSFRPEHIGRNEALSWAKEMGIVCADEYYLHPDPYPSREAWCEARVEHTRKRLDAALAMQPDASFVLINHWPLVQRLAVLPLVPRFTLWCGTQRTNDWHREYPVEAVVFGHLHIRRSLRVDGIRFEEVSLGYPRNWDQYRGVDAYLRTILG